MDLSLRKKIRIEHLIGISFLLIVNIFVFKPQLLNTNIRHNIFLNTGDPCLNLHILEHGFKRLINLNFVDFFDTNIFYPAKYGLTFTEHLIGHQIFYTPLRLLFKSPLFCYNLLTILNYFICSVGVYLFGRTLFKNVSSPIFFAISFTYSSMLTQQIGHFQISSIPWIGFIFLYLLKFLNTNNTRSAYLFLIFWILQSLDSYYIGYMISISVFVTVIFYMLYLKKLREVHLWSTILIITTIFCIVIIPVSLPYIEVRSYYEFKRTLGENILFSADFPLSFIHPSSYNFLFSKVPLKLRELININFGWEKPLFLGFIVTFFIIYFFVSIGQSMKKLENEHKLFLIIGGLFFLLSLGPILNSFNTRIKMPLPYLLFYWTIPGFSSMRVPARFGILYIFCFTAIASYGFNAFHLKLSSLKLRLVLSYSLLCILVFELFPFFPMAYIGDVPNAIIDLRTKAEKGDFNYAYLPSERSINHENNEQQLDPFLSGKYMYYNIFHDKRIVNGYSGYIADSTVQSQIFLSELNDPIFRKNLFKMGIKYLIVFPKYMKKNEVETINILINDGYLSLQRYYDDGTFICVLNPVNEWTISHYDTITFQSYYKNNELLISIKPAKGNLYYAANRRDYFEVAICSLYSENGIKLKELKQKIVIPAVFSGENTILNKEIRNKIIKNTYKIKVHLNNTDLDFDLFINNGQVDIDI